MIISTVTEFDHLLPPNVSSRTERLFTLIEQSERSLLVPVLGETLYAQVRQAYQDICSGTGTDADGHPLAGPDDLLPAVGSRRLTPMQQLIRLLQVPLVYTTLSNNAALLAVSLNDAGLNMVSAEGYDAARKDDREAFSRDCYMNAQRGMEQVLLFLEHDAKSAEPVFLKAWMQSPGFFEHNGLLLRTATEFSRLSGISDNRELFLRLVPSIRNIQQSRIRPELGDLLMNAFIQFSAFGPQQRPEHPSESLPDTPQLLPSDELPVHAGDAEEAFFDDLRPYLPYSRFSAATPGEIFKLRVWTKALSLLRLALVCYVEHDSKQLRRGNDSLNDAMSALSRFCEFVSANTASFQGVIEQSPFYSQPSAPHPDAQPQPQQPSASQSSRTFLHDPFGTFYN